MKIDKLKIFDVVVVGAGFSGLSAAYELSRHNKSVLVLESDKEIGGLASAFDVNGVKLDKFYHHWFTNDEHVMTLINELGLNDQIQINPTNTSMYYANNFYRLSTPLDLLKFKALSFFDRIRLGALTLRVRFIKDWKSLEKKTASEWLKELGGKNVYKIVWEPLLNGKFGPYAQSVSAVWFWNKIKLRGGSRGKRGEERLAYFKGGFVALSDAIAKKIEYFGGKILTNVTVKQIEPRDGIWKIYFADQHILARNVIVTPALPIISNLVDTWADKDYLRALNRIHYLANACLVLELDRSLSNTYWLNVNDPSYPFVGVIEHTNFESSKTYGGNHIVYLSKYLSHTDKLYKMNADQLLNFSYPYLKKMFPKFELSWVKKHHVWKARWAQPVVEKNYSKLIDLTTSPPLKGFYICSMAQIYPEDRGTNYAIREGRKIGKQIGCSL
jgi:protoporphyrinogen oxidase